MFFVFIFFFFDSTYSVLANNFYDDFSSNLTDHWVVPNNGYSLDLSNNVLSGTYGWHKSTIGGTNVLVGEAGFHEKSFIYAKDFNASDYSVDVKAVNINGVDLSLSLRTSDDKLTYYELNFRFNEPDWGQDNNNITMWKRVNGNPTNLVVVPAANIGVNISQNVIHDLKAEVIGNKVICYFDNIKVFEYVDSNAPILSGGFGLTNWGGDFGVGRVINDFYNVNIIDFSITPTSTSIPLPTNTPVPTVTSTAIPTPTNTPIPTNTLTPTSNPTATATPVPKKKIIILPGLGASWNTPSMVSGDVVPGEENNWKMTPFVHEYDALINSLISAGYLPGMDLWVWNYDWRRPVSDITNNLNNFINLKIGPTDKLVLIGHSLGGLVSRTWVQNHNSDSRLDKVLALGSPQLGVVNGYEIWAGGILGDIQNLNPESFAENFLLSVWSANHSETTLGAIQDKLPVFKDLIPTYDFAVKNNHDVPASNMTYKNTWLSTINIGITNVTGKIRSWTGHTVDTKYKINLVARNKYDMALGWWPDGSLGNFIYDKGDGTVLKSSSEYGMGTVQLLETGHRKIVDNSISGIFTVLGLSPEYIASSSFNESDGENSAVWIIGSPAYLVISCPGKSPVTSDVMGFVTISNVSEPCNTQVVGTGMGKYHVMTASGKTGSKPLYWEGNITNGEQQNWLVGWQNSGPYLKSSETGMNNWDLLRQLALELKGEIGNKMKVRLAWKAIDNERVELLTRMVLQIREEKKETGITGQMLKILTEVWSEKLDKRETKQMASVDIKTMEKHLGKLIKSRDRVSQLDAKNYELMVYLLADAKSHFASADYSKVMGDFKIWQGLWERD